MGRSKKTKKIPLFKFSSEEEEASDDDVLFSHKRIVRTAVGSCRIQAAPIQTGELRSAPTCAGSMPPRRDGVATKDKIATNTDEMTEAESSEMGREEEGVPIKEGGNNDAVEVSVLRFSRFSDEDEEAGEEEGEGYAGERVEEEGKKIRKDGEMGTVDDDDYDNDYDDDDEEEEDDDEDGCTREEVEAGEEVADGEGDLAAGPTQPLQRHPSSYMYAQERSDIFFSSDDEDDDNGGGGDDRGDDNGDDNSSGENAEGMSGGAVVGSGFCGGDVRNNGSC
jgi:hypothetical protein